MIDFSLHPARIKEVAELKVMIRSSSSCFWLLPSPALPLERRSAKSLQGKPARRGRAIWDSSQVARQKTGPGEVASRQAMGNVFKLFVCLF